MLCIKTTLKKAIIDGTDMENLVRLNSRNLYYVSIARKCFRAHSVDLAHHIRLNESYKDV